VFQSLNLALLDGRGRLALLGVIQAICAFFEATTIALMIPFLAAVGSVQSSVDSSFVARFGFPAELPTATAAIVLVTAVAGRTAAQVAAAWFWSRSVYQFESDRRRRLLGAFTAASWDCQSREPAGRLQQMLTMNAEQVAKAFTAAASSLTYGVSLLVLVAYAFSVSVFNSVAALAVLAALALIARPLTHRSRSAASERAGALAAYANLVSQCVHLTKELRVFSVERWFLADAARLSDQIGSTRRRQNFLGAVIPVVYQNGSGLLLIGGAVAALLLGASTEASSAVVSVLLLIRAVLYGQHLHSTVHQLQDSIPYLEQLAASQKAYDDHPAASGGESLDRIDELQFENVSYSYAERRPALEDVSFRVTADDVVAVVGPSGAGKSTLAQLLLGLRSPQVGVIRVNGRLRDKIAADAWYARVAYVPQDLTLFGNDIAECVRFHRAGITDEQIRRAAEQAGVLDEIERMPHGFQTPVGERGGTLSHGQRQRVCIARALASDPDLLVFDEPTSALDPDSEARVLQTVRELRGKRITFILAHRAATLGVCNKVLLLHEGRLTAFHDVDAGIEPTAYYRRLIGAAEA
jgi:ABC-type multidrug transport system fused ATPase/permease subunit